MLIVSVLGGLLSSHEILVSKDISMQMPGYQGELLQLAQDLAERMLPAFASPSGIPYPRVNLIHGVPKSHTENTCTAGAGSLVLEFGTLSDHVNDTQYRVNLIYLFLYR